MRTALPTHIKNLEERVQTLRLKYGMTHTTKAERDQIFEQIQIAESALNHYQQGYKLERKVKDAAKSAPIP